MRKGGGGMLIRGEREPRARVWYTRTIEISAPPERTLNKPTALFSTRRNPPKNKTLFLSSIRLLAIGAWYTTTWHWCHPSHLVKYVRLQRLSVNPLLLLRCVGSRFRTQFPTQSKSSCVSCEVPEGVNDHGSLRQESAPVDVHFPPPPPPSRSTPLFHLQTSHCLGCYLLFIFRRRHFPH